MTAEQRKAHRHLLTYLPKRTFLLDGQMERVPFAPNWLEKDRPLSQSEKSTAARIERQSPTSQSCSGLSGMQLSQSIKNDSPA